MNQEMIDAFEDLLGGFVEVCNDFFGDNLVGILLFGAHKHAFVHTQQDVDLLIICIHLPPSSWDRYDMVMQVLERAEALQETMRKQSGFPVYLSPVLRTLDEFNNMESSWVKELKDGRILHDPSMLIKATLEKYQYPGEP